MTNVIKLRGGLDIRLKGKASRQDFALKPTDKYALQPGDFHGVTPKVVVKEGDHVRIGDALFVDKNHPEVGFASPVSGTVESIVRGERRKVLSVVVAADGKQEAVDFGVKDVASMAGDDVVAALLKAGLFGFVMQLPYAVSANPTVRPKNVFVSALRDKPLAADFEYELEGQERAFQTGLTALSKIARTCLGIGVRQTAQALVGARDVDVYAFDGHCPAGNVGVQVNHIDPVNKGEVVWTVDPTVVIFIGRLFLTGRVDLRRKVAFVGSEVKQPAYTEMVVGQGLSTLLDHGICRDCEVRVIDGNVLTGKPTTGDGYLGAYSSEITVIPEGGDANEFAGWIMPRLKQFSVSRSYFSWLRRGCEYALDARVKGGERHIIMSGEYDRVLPMDIYAEFLVKAIIAGDIDKMEQLGIYEVSPEDFALAEFVDSSKLELQRIVREGLDLVRKENG